jgi:hypothetical protein
MCAGRERESEGVQLRAQLGEGSECVGVGCRKGLGREDVAGKRMVVGTSMTKSTGERLGKRGVADRRDLQTSEGERANGRSTLTGRSHRAASERGHERERVGADRSDPPGSGRERGRGRESTRARTQTVAGRWSQPVRQHGRTRSLAGPAWAE